MNVPEFFVQTWEKEMPVFGKVLRALPADKLSYTPHERSTKAGDLAWQLVLEQRSLAGIAGKGEFDWENLPSPGSLDEIIREWDKATDQLRAALQGLDETRWARESKMLMAGTPGWTDTTGGMLFGFLLDMIHHRGQLTSYIRPMGGKVPSIYGPSGDDPGT